MNYLKQIGKVVSSFSFLVMLFAYADLAVASDADCSNLVPVAGECKESSVPLTSTCPVGEYHVSRISCTSSDKICCVKYQKEGSACGYTTPLKGVCRSNVTGLGGCSSAEKKLTNCNPQPPIPASMLECCVSKDEENVPNGDDAACSRLCSGKYTCSAQPSGCPSEYPRQIGTCGANLGFEQKCCVSTTCTPSGSGTATTTVSTSSGSLTYTPLENLPGFEGQSGDFATYFGNLYKLALWIVAISALFMMVVGGFLYLSSAGNTSLLGTAKKTIYSALIGLVIALISWLLLDTINSDLTSLKLSGLSGAIGTSSGSGSSSGTAPVVGSGSGCGGAETQSGAHCEDASQTISDTLKCMVDKLGSKKMQISSISEDSGGKSLFTQCRDNYSKPPCEHTANSCHYGGSGKASKSCAADISSSYTSNSGAASKDEIKAAARSCGVPFVNDEGNHVHISVTGCSCDGHS